mmetsp:Transcript_17523/g.26514  ORF Transcript_17523/g.26514 Transcript_17523/m.26514 type:complete len:347 (-) Transcript_17523:120-1160(-)
MSSARNILPLMARQLGKSSSISRTIVNGNGNGNGINMIMRRSWNSKAKPPPTKLTDLEQYKAEKKAAKERRTQMYAFNTKRKEGESSRRDSTKKYHNRNQFRNWHDELAKRELFLDREARRKGLKWNIKVAAMIERIPIITPDKPDWEMDYLNLFAELQRYDNVRYPKELKMADPMEFEILTEEELLAQLPEGFTPAPRVTEADKSGDVQTLNRKLNTRVYLSIKPNEDEGWMLPTASINIDKKETFLEGAKRATQMVAGESLELFCPSNCPMGVSAVEYTEEERKANGDSFFGEKTFYMRIQYDDGDVEESSAGKMNDWGWLTRDEMVDKVSGNDDAATFYKYML